MIVGDIYRYAQGMQEYKAILTRLSIEEIYSHLNCGAEFMNDVHSLHLRKYCKRQASLRPTGVRYPPTSGAAGSRASFSVHNLRPKDLWTVAEMP